MTYSYKMMKSPVGKLKLVASDRGLAAILWENDNPRRIWLDNLSEDNNHPLLLETERQLNDYFSGKRKSFSMELDFRGTEFQKKVWAALLTISFGETRSYAQIAKQINRPKASRAVGAASAKKSHFDYCTMPPRHRLYRQVDRIRRGASRIKSVFTCFRRGASR